MRVAPETPAPVFAPAAAALGPARIKSIKPRDDSDYGPLGIFIGPAPSPEEGPPGAFYALRDSAYLPAQISGIVGAYILVLCIIGIALLIAKFRLRNLAKKTASLDLELHGAQSSFLTSDTYETPTSAHGDLGGQHSIYSRSSTQNKEPKAYIFPVSYGSPISPGTDPNVDIEVVSADKEILQRQLEELYAHVMEQDAAKAAGVPLAALPTPVYTQPVANIPAESPQRAKLEKKFRPSNIDTITNSEKPQSRTASILSSLKSPAWSRRSTKSIQISSPLPTPLNSTFQPAFDSPPSPRRDYGELPPPPPVPKDQVPLNLTHSRNTSAVSATQHVRSNTTSSVGNDPSPVSSYSHTDTTPLNPRVDVAISLPRSPKPKAKPPTIAVSTTSPAPTAAAAVPRPLPFRAYDPPASLATSPGPFKTTFIQRLPERNGPHTGGLRTPWSAGAVPYSPYQPQTPLMPVTPHLVTREERKERERRERKAGLASPVKEMVGDEEDVWGAGY